MSGNEQPPLDELQADWGLCKEQDERKHLLIERLFAHIHALSGKVAHAESELLDRKDLNTMARDKADKLRSEIKALELEKDRHRFAYVVIDGDCMPFLAERVKQGLEGGRQMAALLKQSVERELQSSDPTRAHNMKVLIRVYANVKGLSKTYKELNNVSEVTFNEFVRGFNMAGVLCDYVDAGNGKESSDVKIKATFELYLADVHCHRILFGGSPDSGYARLFDEYLEDKAICRRITLIEGPPFAWELAEIKDKFRVASFPEVFSNQKLLNIKRKVSFHITPPATPSATYASTTAKPSTPQVNGQSSLASRTAAAPSYAVLRNQHGQRVDSPLSVSQYDLNNVKNRHLCHVFHLLGRCHYMNNCGKCQHTHGESLPPRLKEALRALARPSPCRSGLSCDDADCIAGHRCTYDNCNGLNCRFHHAMHNVDTQVVGATG